MGCLRSVGVRQGLGMPPRGHSGKRDWHKARARLPLQCPHPPERNRHAPTAGAPVDLPSDLKASLWAWCRWHSDGGDALVVPPPLPCVVVDCWACPRTSPWKGHGRDKSEDKSSRFVHPWIDWIHAAAAPTSRNTCPVHAVCSARQLLWRHVPPPPGLPHALRRAGRRKALCKKSECCPQRACDPRGTRCRTQVPVRILSLFATSPVPSDLAQTAQHDGIGRSVRTSRRNKTRNARGSQQRHFCLILDA